MHLTSLELHGFKSFAEKTHIAFLPPTHGRQSITAIVGPNGSGKSNIADAIRWVMGEQSMKALRGKKSEDVIFAGSDTKGQMGLASVTLTINNRDGESDLPYEEIVLTRRLYRSGESEYLCNGNPVRLLDIHLLLAKAQFGQNSYGVIGQGMIDRLLLQTPEERKTFFDEASGIKELQIKRHHALLKLERSQVHMHEASAILEEITPRLKSLSRQVKKVEQRQEVEIQLREKQELYYGSIWRFHEREWQTLGKKRDTVIALLEEKESIIHTMQRDVEMLAEEKGGGDVFASLQSEFQKLLRDKSTRERDRAVIHGKLQIAYSKAGLQKHGWLEQKLDTLSRDIEAIDQDQKTLDQSIVRLMKQVTETRRLVEHAQMQKTVLKSKLQTLQYRALEKKGEESVFQFTGMRAVQALLTDKQRFGTIYGMVAQLGDVEETYQLALDVAASHHLSSLVVDSDTTAEACIAYLRQEQLGVATFLPQHTIKPRFMAHDIEKLLREKGVRGLAVSFVRTDAKFSNIFSYILGNTIIVDDIAVARRLGIGRIRMVTLLGDVLETSGTMKGGFRLRKERGMVSFSRRGIGVAEGPVAVSEQDIRALEIALEDQERLYEKAQETLRKSETSLFALEEKKNLLLQRKNEIIKEHAALEQERRLLSMNAEEYDTAMETIRQSKESLDREIEAIDGAIGTLDAKMRAFHEETEKKKERLFALQRNMLMDQQSLQKMMEEKNILNIELAKFETRKEDIENELYQELRVSMQSLLERRTIEILSPTQLEEVLRQMQKLKYQLSLIGGIDEEIMQEYTETKVRHEQMSSELTDLTKATADLEVLVAELDEMMRKKRQKAFKEIRKEFATYFGLLFGGGKADLFEVYAEEEKEEGDMTKEEPIFRGKEALLLKGIDIMASPPGKKIKHIQALSGGERTLTAIALVCAILHTNPPPFVVLDEVEAALDEVNTIRFTTIIQELSKQSQFVLITHNRATMHAADVLYGVTMGGEGVSKVVSVKFEK